MEVVVSVILKNVEVKVFACENDKVNPYKIFVLKDGKMFFANDYSEMGSVLAWIGDLRNGEISCRDNRTIQFDFEGTAD